MLIQLLVGALVSAIAITIHAFATVVAIGVARRVARWPKALPRLHLMSVMVATVLVLMLAHIGEVVVWSLSYAIVGAAPAGSGAGNRNAGHQKAGGDDLDCKSLNRSFHGVDLLSLSITPKHRCCGGASRPGNCIKFEQARRPTG